ncbi:RagB/SusD family nutrient uptake outer membrane protein [Parapedobacter sp. DT-150]|uniref:RagB/SusD family nutrient uptake outer membrane protein n=1 Tax=Parapedobacter sp. DT-150 TaxID=3396162 RepID=UPI003F1D410F
MFRHNIIRNSSMLTSILALCFGSCNDYFDEVPDNIVTIDQIFVNRNQTIEWLAGVYSYVPDPWDQPFNTHRESTWPAMTDELDYAWDETGDAVVAGLNLQPNNDDVFNIYSRYYQGIRKANIFLQNVDRNIEIVAQDGQERVTQYKGEARFLRAYYYFQLMKIYGPVVLMGDEAGTTDTDFQKPRSTWQECVDYVMTELELAKADVPAQHLDGNNSPDLFQVGRITKGIVMAVQSQVLLFNASPLFNGNTELADFRNPEGNTLIPQTYDATKWAAAADAAKAVIDLGTWSLYEENDADPFRKAYLSTRNVFWAGCYTEGIWLRPSSTYQHSWERHASPRNTSGQAWNGIAPFQEVVDAFRMENGLTIDNSAAGYTENGFAPGKSGYYVDNTSNMYVGREPRFYAYITFSGATLPTVPASGQTHVQFFNTGNNGKANAPRDWPISGYTARKNIHPTVNFSPITTASRPAMLIRLSEIYLNYAEALNEYDPGNPDILTYLNAVRNRGGIPSLAAGSSQAEMREHIRNERRVELCFEGQRYFDVRRWKTVTTPEDHQGGEFYGMNMDAGTSLTDPSFYERIVVLRKPGWNRRNYFWPIPQAEIDRNKQLVQFPGY